MDLPAICENTQDRIQHRVQILRDILGEEAQNNIAILLQQPILAPVAAVRNRIAEVLRTVEFDRHTRLVAQEIDLHAAECIKWDRQARVQSKTPRSARQRLKTAVQKGLGSTACAIYAFRIRRERARRINE